MDHGGEAGDQNAIPEFLVDEQLDLGFPLRSLLDFIEKQGGHLALRIGIFMKERRDHPILYILKIKLDLGDSHPSLGRSRCRRFRWVWC